MAKKAADASTKTTTKVAKSITINFQKPGELPAKLKIANGTTVQQLAEELNLTGYAISVDGSSVGANSSKVLVKDSTVRVGIRTKNAGK